MAVFHGDLRMRLGKFPLDPALRIVAGDHERPELRLRQGGQRTYGLVLQKQQAAVLRKRPAAKRQEGQVGHDLAGPARGEREQLLSGLDQHAVAPWVVQQPMDGSAVQAFAVAQRDEGPRGGVEVRDSPLLVRQVLQKKQMPVPVAGNLGHIALQIDRAARSGGHVKTEKGSLRTAVGQAHEQIQRFAANRAAAHEGKASLPFAGKEIQPRKAVKRRAVLRNVHAVERTVQFIEAVERFPVTEKQRDEGGVLLQPIRNGLILADAVKTQHLRRDELEFGTGVAKRQRRGLPGFQIKLIQAFGDGEQICLAICHD